jgi:hypothetical protein
VKYQQIGMNPVGGVDWLLEEARIMPKFTQGLPFHDKQGLLSGSFGKQGGHEMYAEQLGRWRGKPVSDESWSWGRPVLVGGRQAVVKTIADARTRATSSGENYCGRPNSEHDMNRCAQ